MIIIPELETVLILTPRTGSGSLKKAVLGKWPRAMLLYRHMEADGVPAGYDRWQKVGVVRHPLERLWSLYKFIQNMQPYHEPDYREAQRRSAATRLDFSDWILNNETVFTSPYDAGNRGRFYPTHTVRHALPENRKSQFMYLRPDLGTKVYQFNDLERLAARLGVGLPQENATDNRRIPAISHDALLYMQRAFYWDYSATEETRKCAA